MLRQPNDLERRISTGDIRYRSLVRHRDRLHPRQTSRLIHDAPSQSNDQFVLWIAGVWRPQSHHRQMVRLEPDVGM